MQARERITLLRPDRQEGVTNPVGYTRIIVYAVRMDTGGRTLNTQEIEEKDWDTRFEVYAHGFERVDQRWLIEDQFERRYVVMAVAHSDRRKRNILLYATRKV